VPKIEAVVKRVGSRVTYTAEHRTGVCESCGTACVKIEVVIDGQPKIRPRCPKCGGQGKLISRVVSVAPPAPPTCLSFGCLGKYIRDSLFCALLASYHSRRVTYAEKNKHKKILDRYRTGEPSPTTIWQAIHANIKLKCPVCRRYNVDPFLFRSK